MVAVSKAIKNYGQSSNQGWALKWGDENILLEWQYLEQDTQSMYFQRSKLNVNNKHLCLKYGQENDGISIYEDYN